MRFLKRGAMECNELQLTQGEKNYTFYNRKLSQLTIGGVFDIYYGITTLYLQI